MLEHDVFFEELRQREFSRLDNTNQIYLDFTGGNLYAQSQIDRHFELLKNNVLGNPHSTNPTSRLATKLCEDARDRVLSFFNASDYFCIFTQNASGALKIVGECYPFDESGNFLLFADDHNSVNGIREYAKRRGADFSYVTMNYEDLRVNEEDLDSKLASQPNAKNKLFAFPAQSNVSGVKHSLDIIERAQNFGWDVMLDAAAFVPTSKLDLSNYKPDFVSVSFYKIFGFPTGIGCLLVKKSKFNKLKKQWFAGGTVTAVAVMSPNHFLAENHERFENGTINYLDIPALSFGFDFIESIGLQKINERVKSLTVYLYSELKKLTHENGTPLVHLFGPKDKSETGGNIIMTFVDKEGKLMPFDLIEQLSNQENISIRSGCFCNPGIDEVNNCLTNEELSQYFSSRDKGNFKEMLQYLNKMRGAIRVSVGIATVKKDLDKYISLVASFQNKKMEELELTLNV